MPDQERVKGADGREYIVLPSGRRFPAEELEGNPSGATSTLGKISRAVLNPETIGTAASFLAPETGGASMLIPAAAGAAWSVGEDLLGGNRDPASIAGHALTHGAVNAIPGVVRGAMSKGSEGSLPLVSAASRMVGGWKGKLLQTLTSGMGAAGGTATAAGLSPELLSATLPNGLKIASADGLRTLLQKSVELENAGAPRATIDALDTLIGQVRAHLSTVASQPMNVLTRAGLPATTAGAASGGRYANMLRAILPIGSSVNEAAR